MKLNIAATLGLFLLATASQVHVQAQNKLPQNLFGRHALLEEEAVANMKKREEAKKVVQVPPFQHSQTVLLDSAIQINEAGRSCPDARQDVIYTTPDKSFEYAMKSAAGQKWDSLVQDCWAFVKVTKRSADIARDVSSNHLYFQAITKLEKIGVLDDSNAQYQLRGSKEVFNQAQGDQVVSISAFRVADLRLYK